MDIKSLVISNYKNLNDISLDFHNKINSIVGKNNIGKTNILRLIRKITNARNFYESDFYDVNKPINVEITLSLNDYEIGIFEDYFDYKDASLITLIIEQDNPESELVIKDQYSGDILANNTLKNINYMYYDSMRKPETKGDILQNNSNFRVVNYILDKELQNQESELINYSEKTKTIIMRISEIINKIESIADHDLSISLNKEEQTEQLKKVVTLTNEEGFGIESMGYGTQYSTMIPLNIINNLISKYRYKESFERMISIDEEGKKYIHLIIGIDEPEIHLHPHLQRKTINYLSSILSGKNSNFNSLINYLFEEIDYMTGQLIVATHSPYILSDNFQNFIRMYELNGKTEAISGNNLTFDDSRLFSHLMKSMPTLKKCFFSKVVIFVEGDTELPALQEFSEKMEVDLDKYEIEVIVAGSKDTIPVLSELYLNFGINSISVIDTDDDNPRIEKYKNIHNVKFTKNRDFEEDIIEEIELNQFFDYAYIASNKEFKLKEKFIGYLSNTDIENWRERLNLTLTDFEDIYEDIVKKFSAEELENIKNSNQDKIYNFLENNKSSINGYLLSSVLREDQIPEVYKNTLIEARELSIHGQ